MTLSFRKLHWGDAPVTSIDVTWPSDEPAEPIGELRAVSYVTAKRGDGGSVYRHEFDRHEGRLPYLLRLARDGAWRTPRLSESTVSLGYAIDLELDDGTIIVPTHHVIITNKSAGAAGHPVGIAVLGDNLPLWGVETRLIHGRYMPHITPHGIER